MTVPDNLFSEAESTSLNARVYDSLTRARNFGGRRTGTIGRLCDSKNPRIGPGKMDGSPRYIFRKIAVYNRDQVAQLTSSKWRSL